MKLPVPTDPAGPFWRDQDGTEHINADEAIGHLLLAGYLFVGELADTGCACVFVDCGDLFYWGSADAERLPRSEVENLYRSILQHGDANHWACQRRNLRPQAPVVKRMQSRGQWTPELEALPAPAPS